MSSLPHPRIVPTACPLPGGGRVYSYFIDAAYPTLVDAGVAASPGSVIADELGRHGLHLGDVRLVVNTHGHWDHLGGDAALRDEGARVAIHPDDAPLLRSREAHVAGYWGQRLRLAGKPIDPGRALLLEHIAGEIEPDRELAHGDRVDLGGGAHLTVVHTPGHSAGSVSLWWESEGVLLVGDAVQGAGSAGSRCPFYVDPDRYRASLVAMQDLRARVLCGGHEFRWGAEAAWVTEERAVATALRTSLDAEAALRTAAASDDGFARLRETLEWDQGVTPEPLGLTLAGYRSA